MKLNKCDVNWYRTNSQNLYSSGKFSLLQRKHVIKERDSSVQQLRLEIVRVSRETTRLPKSPNNRKSTQYQRKLPASRHKEQENLSVAHHIWCQKLRLHLAEAVISASVQSKMVILVALSA